MKAKELIKALEPYAEKEIDILCYPRTGSLEIWTAGGDDLIYEFNAMIE